MIKNFPHYKQLDAMDCGATCLRMIAKHYDKSYTAFRVNLIRSLNPSQIHKTSFVIS